MSKKRDTLIDTKGFGRPSSFGAGTQPELEKKFPVWSRKVHNFIVGVYPDMKDALEWAMESQKEIPAELAETTYGTSADDLERIDDFVHLNMQLHTSLVHLRGQRHCEQFEARIGSLEETIPTL